MKIFTNPAHEGHDGASELKAGALGRCHDNPDRLAGVARRLSAMDHDAAPPRASWEHIQDVVLNVHDADYVRFLRHAWADWVTARGRAAEETPDALPLIWPTHALRRICPETVEGRLSYYALDAGTPITSGMWAAVSEAAVCAVETADTILRGESAAFALVRPPGHHAGRDYYGGYGFLNNAAIAVQRLRDGGARRVAVVDVDYHHGNGTQSLFYDRADVFFLSLHADPKTEFPFFLGHADETGAGDGDGRTLNLPLSKGMRADAYLAALDHGLDAVRAYRPDAVVVSLGLDAYERDPLGTFHLGKGDFGRVADRVRGLGAPTAIILEGGYAPADDLGDILAGALHRFEA